MGWTVAESPDHFLAFVGAMFVIQPAQKTPRAWRMPRSRPSCPRWAVVTRIPDHEYSFWVRMATELASKDGLPFTPTVAIDGVMQNPRDNPGDLYWSVEGALEQAIRDAAGQ